MADMWNNAVVTTKGLLLQSKVATGGTINFTKIKTGSGTVTASQLQSQTDVTSKKQEFLFSAESTVNKETGLVTLVAIIDNKGLTTGYNCYQVGVYANDPDDGEILYAIMQSDTALSVPTEANVVGWIAEMNIGMQYGNASTVNISMNQAGVVTRDVFDAHVNMANPHGTKAADVGARPSNWMPTAAQVGARPSNWMPTAEEVGARPSTWTPTAAQVGLGNVPNVSTNDQTPTYTQSSTLVNLTSGEKLGVAMGKIAKAVSVLVSHLADKNNPHGATAEQVGAFPANGITYGTAPLTDGVSKLPTGHVYLQYEE